MKFLIMKKNRKNLLYFILSLTIAAITFYFYSSKDLGTSMKQGRDFSVNSDENITKITFSDKDSTLVLLEKENDKWILNGKYSGNDFAVKDLIRTLKNIRARLPVPIEIRDSISDQLHHEGVRVEIFAKRYILPLGKYKLLPFTKKIKSFYVGNDYDNMGTFMQIESANTPFIAHIPGYDAGISESFSPNPFVWRDPVVTNLQSHEILWVKVFIKEKDSESFQINNKNDNVEFKDPVSNEVLELKYDTARVRRFLNSFEDLYFERIIHGDEKSEIETKLSNQEAAFILEIKAKSTELTKLEFFYKFLTEKEKEKLGTSIETDPNLLYLRINENEYAYARYFLFNRVLRPLSFFKKED